MAAERKQVDKRKTEVLRAMLEVAYADGTFDGQEQLAVANILGYLGYTAEEVRAASEMTHSDNQAALETVLADPEDRLEALGDLITVALADGLINNDELAYLKKMARRLGFSEDEFNDRKLAVLRGLEQS